MEQGAKGIAEICSSVKKGKKGEKVGWLVGGSAFIHSLAWNEEHRCNSSSAHQLKEGEMVLGYGGGMFDT